MGGRRREPPRRPAVAGRAGGERSDATVTSEAGSAAAIGCQSDAESESGDRGEIPRVGTRSIDAREAMSRMRQQRVRRAQGSAPGAFGGKTAA